MDVSTRFLEFLVSEHGVNDAELHDLLCESYMEKIKLNVDGKSPDNFLLVKF